MPLEPILDAPRESLEPKVPVARNIAALQVRRRHYLDEVLEFCDNAHLPDGSEELDRLEELEGLKELSELLKEEAEELSYLAQVAELTEEEERELKEEELARSHERWGDILEWTDEEREEEIAAERDVTATSWLRYTERSRRIKYPIVPYQNTPHAAVAPGGNVELLEMADYWNSDPLRNPAYDQSELEHRLATLNQNVVRTQEELARAWPESNRDVKKQLILMYDIERNKIVDISNRIARDHLRAEKPVIERGEATHRPPKGEAEQHTLSEHEENLQGPAFSAGRGSASSSGSPAQSTTNTEKKKKEEQQQKKKKKKEKQQQKKCLDVRWDGQRGTRSFRFVFFPGPNDDRVE